MKKLMFVLAAAFPVLAGHAASCRNLIWIAQIHFAGGDRVGRGSDLFLVHK